MENNLPCQDCALRKSNAFMRNKDDEIAFIERFKTRSLALQPGTLIIADGLPSEDLYTPYSGWAPKSGTPSALGTMIS